MIKVKKDLVGQRFGRLVVTRQVEDYISKAGRHYARWECQCDCGSEPIEVTGSNLTQKHAQSCGCLNREIASTSHKKYNDYQLNLADEHGLYGIGYCTNTCSEFYFDMDDYDKVKNGNWIEVIPSSGYHILQSWDKESKTIVRMHWLIIGKYYDHADRNPLNNRKYNLRKATFTENAQNQPIKKTNTSGFIGVTWLKNKNRWVAYITIEKKRKHLGLFVDKEDAICVRLRAEKEYFGEFAPQQHLFKKYGIEDEFLENNT